MNFLRKDLAPISTEGWDEIESVARETLSSALSARKFVTLDGPHGFAYAAVPLGRLSLPMEPAAGTVGYGIRQVLPLVESRIPFSLDIWELDNLARGAKDVSLDPLTAACREIAKFEERAIYAGFAPAGIQGLHKAAQNPKPLPLDVPTMIDAVCDAQAEMVAKGVAGAANLVVSAQVWKFLAHGVPGGTVKSLIEKQIGGTVLYSDTVDGALMVSARGGDACLTLGQDFAIGYLSHSSREVQLYLTESFTFRVVAPEALISFAVEEA